MEKPPSNFRPPRPRRTPLASLWLWYAPELALCRTQFEFTEATARQKQSPHMRALMGPLILYLAVVAALVFAPRYFLPSGLGRYGPVFAIVVVSLLLSLWVSHLGRDRSRHRIRQYLYARGVPLCLECGYDLSGEDASATPRCPECGEPLSERENPTSSEAPS